MRVLFIIPARYDSERLPGKPLALIHEKPLIQWTYENVQRIVQGIAKEWGDGNESLSVVVATDDERISRTVEVFGGEVVMTSRLLKSGTDRIAEVAQKKDAEIYINVQGDEPLLSKEAVLGALEKVKSEGFEIGTTATHISTRDDLLNSSVVKVLVDQKGKAVYFSRHPIPYSRQVIPPDPKDYPALKHMGLYVYTKDSLQRFCALQLSSWEEGEGLEQLRALGAGMSIGVALVKEDSIGVDTSEDLEKVKTLLAKSK
jgi:3-deoxy-D-manno-octulosonate cytidylyltransferase